MSQAEVLATPVCLPGNSDLTCRLNSFLHLLNVVAVILGTLLLLVIAVAVALYRKNRRGRSGRP